MTEAINTVEARIEAANAMAFGYLVHQIVMPEEFFDLAMREIRASITDEISHYLSMADIEEDNALEITTGELYGAVCTRIHGKTDKEVREETHRIWDESVAEEIRQQAA